MTKRNQKVGLTVVAAAVAIFAVAGAEYVRWSGQFTNDVALSSDGDSVREIPDGWKVYRNDEAGYRFYYPDTWGAFEDTAEKTVSKPAWTGEEATITSLSGVALDQGELEVTVYPLDFLPTADLIYYWAEKAPYWFNADGTPSEYVPDKETLGRFDRYGAAHGDIGGGTQQQILIDAAGDKIYVFEVRTHGMLAVEPLDRALIEGNGYTVPQIRLQNAINEKLDAVVDTFELL